MILEDLRKPKIHIGDMDIAIFDVLATIGGGYFLAEKMKWDKKKTNPGMFVLGYLAHNMTGTETPLNTYINQVISQIATFHELQLSPIACPDFDLKTFSPVIYST